MKRTKRPISKVSETNQGQDQIKQEKKQSPDAEKTTVKTGKKDHRFKKGQSGNPAGRPKGSKNKVAGAINEIVRKDARYITHRLVNKARKGDMNAIKLVMDRILPPAKDQPISCDLPNVTTAKDCLQYLSILMKETAAGAVPVTEALKLSGLAEKFLKAVETVDFEDRLKELENRLKT